MAEKDSGRLSDTEGGEKPVREQLKKAHIAEQNGPRSDAATDEQSTQAADSNGNTVVDERGRLQKKRSHEEVDAGSQDVNSEPIRQHARKRSRDSTAEEDALNNGQRKVSGEGARGDGVAMETDESHTTDVQRETTPELSGEKRSEAAVEALSSPKSKRSRLHSTITDAKVNLSEGEAAPASDNGGRLHNAADAKSETAAESRSAEPATKTRPGSAFGNTSSSSPFGALAGSKPPSSEPQNSSSAFAASGFSALASSSSGFGSLGKESSGGFGSGGTFATGSKSSSANKENEKSPPSSFGGALGQQSAFSAAPGPSGGFGSGTSGFGKLGSSTAGGFGGALGGSGFGRLGGGGLTSFASGKAVTPAGKATKPFGANNEGDDEADGADDEDDDKAGAKSPLATEEEKQDERFYEQELETGEEDEITEFSCRAKLYNFAPTPDGKKEWRERGLGVLRFNVRKASPDEGIKSKGRLLMRADGSHRVVLNTPVKKEIKFGSPAGGPPEGGYLYFMGTIDGKDGLELLQLKMKQANALDLHSHISSLQDDC